MIDDTLLQYLRNEAKRLESNGEVPQAVVAWQRVIDYDQFNSEGYCGVVRCEMLQYHDGVAQRICQEGLKRLPDSEEMLVAWATIATRKSQYATAIKRWNKVAELFPNNGESRLKLAEIYFNNGEYAEALTWCQDALANRIKKSEIYLMFIKIYLATHQNDEIWDFIFEHEAYLVANHKILKNIVDLLILFNHHITNTKNVISLTSKITENNSRFIHRYKILAFIANNYPKYSPYLNDILKTNLPIILTYSIEEKLHILQLISLFPNILNTIHTNYRKLLISVISPFTKQSTYTHKTDRKICFFIHREALPFFAPLIRAIPHTRIDLVYGHHAPLSESVIYDLGLQQYNHFYGPEFLQYYDILVGDYYIGDWTKPNQHSICLFHSMDGTLDHKKLINVSAFIAPSYNHAIYNNIATPINCIDDITSIDVNKKCEFSYSGPYSAEIYKYINKSELRHSIIEQYNINIDTNRPLVYWPSDHTSFRGHEIYCLNKIAKYCTVLYKNFPNHLIERYDKKLSNEVIFIKDDTYSANTLRFAADWTVAGISSGTLVSCILLELPVIPYYSRFMPLTHDQHVYATGDKFISNLKHGFLNYKHKVADCNHPTNKLWKLLYKHSMLFDLLHHDKFVDAFIQNDYSDKYFSILPRIQKEVFGSYIMCGCTEKTANLILKFAQDLTFGHDCSAIYLKP